MNKYLIIRKQTFHQILKKIMLNKFLILEINIKIQCQKQGIIQLNKFLIILYHKQNIELLIIKEIQLKKDQNL